MVSSGAIVAAVIAARHRHLERERKRREDENRRRREAENRRRREAERKEAERRRMEEEARARHKAEQKKLLHHQQYKAKVLANNKNSSQNLVFTDKLEIPLNELKVVHKSMNEELLVDGSRMYCYVDESWGSTYYERTFPDGRHQEYIETLDKERNECLRLLKEELPDGQVVLYDNDGRKTYEKDAEGNYSVYQYDGYSDKIVNTKKGKCEYLEPDKFTDKLEIPSDELEEVYRKGDERLLSDGSRMYCYVDESWGSTYYERTFPDGRHQEYIETLDKERNECLRLLKEELPNGEIVSFDESGRKTYEKDAQGNSRFCKYEVSGKRTEVIGNNENWKETTYDENGKIEYYRTSDEPKKSYYPSGSLREEIKDNGECYRYAENGICLYENQGGGTYTVYQLTPDGKDRQLLTRMEKGCCMENCSYYASGQLKERSVRNVGVYRYAENGLCLYEYLDCGDCEHYMLTPDGKDRLLLEKSKDGKRETHSYYPSGKLESSSFSNGDVIKYDEDGNYQKFDGKERLIEEKNSLGKTVYSYYPDTSQVKHINKYDEKGQEIRSEYRHFDKKGNDDTQYYLNIKKMIAKKIQKDAEEAKKRIGFEGERKVGRKMSDVSKLVLVMKARMRK